MSSLLEQAIVDAKALKEAAMKNAEATIIDKYSEEVKSTLNQLLEQDELGALLGGDDASPDAEAAMEEEVQSDEIAEGVPDAFTEDVAEFDGATEGAESQVTIDFAELAEALRELREGTEEETLEEAEEETLEEAEEDATVDEELELDEETIMEMVAAMLSEEKEEVDERMSFAKGRENPKYLNAPKDSPLGQQRAADEEAQLSPECKEIHSDYKRAQQKLKNLLDAAGVSASDAMMSRGGVFRDGSDQKAYERISGYIDDEYKKYREAGCHKIARLSETEEVEEGVLKGTPKNPVSRNPKSTAATTAAAEREKELNKKRQRDADKREREKSFYGNIDRYGNKLEEGEDLYEELSDEMLDAIMEKLTVDMGATLSGWAGRSEESVKHQMELEMAHRRSTEVEEELEALKKAQEELVFENNKLKENLSNYQEVVESLKENVQDVNLSNARLLYTNRTLRNTSLNERQKERIVEAISKAGSVEEAKTIHETLQSTVASTPTRGPQSLSEAITRPTSVIRASRKEQPKADPFQARMRKLAGLE